MRLCKHCKANVGSKNKANVFCNSSCSAKFNNVRRKKIKLKPLCLNCAIRNNTGKKFCSSRCSGDYWRKVRVTPRIIRGECSGPVTLKRYLRETVGDFCVECEVGNNWNGKPLNMQLDHIDGNSDNNHLNNLRLLCPNCHSQTPTYNRNNAFNTKRKRYLKKWRNSNAPIAQLV